MGFFGTTEVVPCYKAKAAAEAHVEQPALLPGIKPLHRSAKSAERAGDEAPAYQPGLATGLPGEELVAGGGGEVGYGGGGGVGVAVEALDGFGAFGFGHLEGLFGFAENDYRGAAIAVGEPKTG